MTKCVLRDSTEIGTSQQPYIVAEVNTSHNGSVETAKLMIDAIKESGCNCVKFQSWTTDTLYSNTFYAENPIAKRIFNKFSFSETELLEVANYCGKVGIAFSSTPYSIKEVDFLLNACNVPFIKIASMDVNNYAFIDYVSRTGVPIILATGMADMKEIHDAVNTIAKTGNRNLCLLHCISIYPPEISTINLKNILGLKKEFPAYPVGFSDHSLGIEMASAAIALGAVLIEKHFTLDSTKIGMDNQIAIEPNEMKQLVKNCHNVYSALGTEKRIIHEAESEQRKKMRRSVVVTRDLKAGEIISVGDLDAKRPGTGISPNEIKNIIGKTIVRDIEADTLLTENHIK